MAVSIRFDLNDSLFTRDPQETSLGKKIISEGILLMDELGFEGFTFKKLATRIGSTEASIYRYFENKHFFLLYLTNWYWEWVLYLIDSETKNVSDPAEKLKIAIRMIVFATADNPSIEYVNEDVLHRVVIAEGTKSYHTVTVDARNKEGLFISYKTLTAKLAEIIEGIRPDFPYKRSLASNLFEMASNQIYFAEHLPRLTDLGQEEGSEEDLITMLTFFAEQLLRE